MTFSVEASTLANDRRDKKTSSDVWSLNADGTRTLWRGPLVDPEVLLVQGEPQEIADWLTTTRWKHAELCRGTGWALYFKVYAMAKQHEALYPSLGAFHVVIKWYRTVDFPPLVREGDERTTLQENWQGPIQDVGVVFLEYYAWCVDYLEYARAREAAIMNVATQRAVEDIVAVMDAEALEATRTT